jgi:ribosomal protein S18 acetylase RimI-like enzyme
MKSVENVKVRLLTKEDLEAIVRIDEKVLGGKKGFSEPRREYWERKLDQTLTQASLVAEEEGQVVGFILGEVSGWEFGVPDTTGWIDTLGIDPNYQGKGLATILMRELVSHLKRIGVKTVYTLVNWNDWDLLQFFHSMGFERGDMINLELKI